ncbi:hypothetical protein K435DRAFT_786578 [Dendrothele bispora CBS 962.96]|uniref:Uncharacterized protein n=1 Tax=Dendrothele bispora (strain CBS 962.96) TaxID=1314807 RepID=A0A4S8KQA3_DENBC|nr:hypothetical protein K435DRAFT_786578 [Dendrothele bispora CBS 962.96]
MSFRIHNQAVEPHVDPCSPYCAISQSLVSSLDPTFYGLVFSAPLTLSLRSYAFTAPTSFVITDTIPFGKDVLIGKDFVGACSRAGLSVPVLGITAISSTTTEPAVHTPRSSLQPSSSSSVSGIPHEPTFVDAPTCFVQAPLRILTLICLHLHTPHRSREQCKTIY